MHHLCGLKIVFKKAPCVLVKDPFSVAGGCLFLANLLLALWTIGPRCACDAVRAVASSGRLVPPRQEEFWEVFFGHLLYVSQVTSWLGYGRSCCCHSDQGPLKAGYLARRVHLFQRFSKSPPPPPTADLLPFLVIDLDFRGEKTTTLMWVQRMEIKLEHI